MSLLLTASLLRCPFLKHRKIHRVVPPVKSSLWTVAVPVAIASFIPISIFADAVVDKVTDRVGKRTNTTADGVPCYLSFPEGFSLIQKDTFEQQTPPVVFLLPELYGLLEREVELCDELARLGYISCAVDVLSRRSSTWIPRVIGFFIGEVALRQDPDYGASTVKKTVKWMRGQDWCSKDTPFGIVGFCYGGAGSIRSVLASPDTFSATVVFYGKPPSELKEDSIRCPVLALYGTEDSQFSKEVIDAFEDGLKRASPGSEVIRFPGEGHAFVKDLSSTKTPGAAKEAWSRCLQFLNKNLTR